MPASTPDGRPPRLALEAEILLPPQATAPRLGRESVRRTLGAAPQEAIDRIELLVSELITNAVTHAALAGGQSVELRVRLDRAVVRVEVRDPGAHFDLPPTLPEGAESRWGLVLVDRLSDRWGIRPHRRGKTVWFELDL